MPHQCVRCGKLYADGELNVLQGCSCGAKMFYFLRANKYKEMQELAKKKEILSGDQREQIEQDVYDMMGNEIDRDKPVILDIESIEVLKPGQYNLDLVKLFQGESPLIYKLEDGKYFVDVIESFKKLRVPKKR